jgi:hypothetical protein
MFLANNGVNYRYCPVTFYAKDAMQVIF